MESNYNCDYCKDTKCLPYRFDKDQTVNCHYCNSIESQIDFIKNEIAYLKCEIKKLRGDIKQ